MADQKTTALGAIPILDIADVLAIVDATDTTSKKVSVAQLDGRYSTTPYQDYLAGNEQPSGMASAASYATQSWGLNQLWMAPLLVRKTRTFDQVKIFLGATANVRFGIYDSDGANGKPGTLIADLGAIAATGAGNKTLAISQSLAGRKWYWLGIVSDTTVVMSSTAQGVPIWSLPDPSSGAIALGPWMSHTYGALPATFTESGFASNVPLMVLRAA